MRAAWGTYLFPVNGAEVTSQMSVAEATDYGLPLRYLVAYTIKVWLDGDGAAALSLAEVRLRSALMTHNQDFVLYSDSGSATSSAVYARQSANGTRVVSISAPEAQGGEYVNRRTIAFTVLAEYHVANAQNAVVSWSEAVSIVGNGGPRRVWRFPINGPAVRQQITPYSLVRATQSGQAVGYLRRVPKPAPLFPLYMVHEAESATFQTPKYMGPTGAPVDWPTSWSYTFERGDGPLAGVPKLPPGVI